MHDDHTTFRIAAGSSPLSRWQASHLEKLLKKKHATRRFESVFVEKDVFKAIKDGEVDFAVFDQKDLPVEDSKGLTIAAVLKRDSPGDVLISRDGHTLESLPENSRVGTRTLSCRGQLLFARKDLSVAECTNGLEDGDFDAIIVPFADVRRLKREDLISEMLGFDFMLPSPGQGALAVLCATKANQIEFLTPLHDEKTHLATLAERSYLKGLGGGLKLPVAAFAQVSRKMLTLAAAVIAPDGSEKHLLQTTIDVPADVSEARACVVTLGRKLAKIALEDGALALMERRA